MATPNTLREYQRIECAIQFILEHWHEQPRLAQIAQSVNLSPHHFQRMFTAWAGISPKKFVQFLSVQYAKTLLKQQNVNVLAVAQQIGLSGSSRLHDLFVSLEAMTPGEFRGGGGGLVINYSIASTLFGDALVASTARGICHVSFVADSPQAVSELQQRFHGAECREVDNEHQHAAFKFLTEPRHSPAKTLALHLAGTPFQIKVWQALLRIPAATVASYQDVARALGQPSASRAVASAIARNPIAFIVPCHRVIRSSGVIGEYRWGTPRKAAIIGWEAASQCRDYQPVAE